MFVKVPTPWLNANIHAGQWILVHPSPKSTSNASSLPHCKRGTSLPAPSSKPSQDNPPDSQTHSPDPAANPQRRLSYQSTRSANPLPDPHRRLYYQSHGANPPGGGSAGEEDSRQRWQPSSTISHWAGECPRPWASVLLRPLSICAAHPSAASAKTTQSHH